MIDCLQENEFISGETLSRKFKVSRTTISSWIKELEVFGLTIHRVKGKGYRLIDRLQLLDKELIRSDIPPQLLESISVIDIVAETLSTNQTALSSNYLDDKWKIFASEYQHSGRGRRGRQWVSPIGTNLLFSLARKSLWPSSILYGASILAGIAVAEILQAYINAPVKIKWPNDIYINDSKVAGILCEMQGNPADEALLVIGVGINVFNSPELPDKSTTDMLKHSAIDLDRSCLLVELIKGMLGSIDRAIDNSESTYTLWAKYDYLYGKLIEIHQGRSIIEGIANGIDESGQLRLILPSGERKLFNGGEVSVRW